MPALRGAHSGLLCRAQPRSADSANLLLPRLRGGSAARPRAQGRLETGCHLPRLSILRAAVGGGRLRGSRARSRHHPGGRAFHSLVPVGSHQAVQCAGRREANEWGAVHSCRVRRSQPPAAVAPQGIHGGQAPSCASALIGGPVSPGLFFPLVFFPSTAGARRRAPQPPAPIPRQSGHRRERTVQG